VEPVEDQGMPLLAREALPTSVVQVARVVIQPAERRGRNPVVEAGAPVLVPRLGPVLRVNC